MADDVERDCIFCRIVRGEADAHRIYEDDLSLAILDINPFSEGHCLVIPKRHVPWWHDLTEEEIQSLFKSARKVAQKMSKAFEPDLVTMYVRGRRISHTHIFLVPTYSGDVLDSFFNALGSFQESIEELSLLKKAKSMDDAAERLRSA